MARGKAYPTAIRALAFKWQRIMFVCWRDRVPYGNNLPPESPTQRLTPCPQTQPTSPKAA